MADNTQINQNVTAGDIIATLDTGTVKHEKVIAEFIEAGAPVMVSEVNPLPVNKEGLATEEKQDDANILLTNIAAITQPLTDIELRDTPVQVDIYKYGGALTTLGQKLAVASAPVVIAIDQTPIPTTGTISGGQLSILGITNVRSGQADNSAFIEGISFEQPIGGIVDDVATMPVLEGFTGAVRITGLRGMHVNLRDVAGSEIGTIANPLQTTVTFPAEQNSNINQIGGAPYSQGQKLAALSAPVVLAIDQSAIPVTFTPVAEQNVNLNQVGGVATTLGGKLSALSIPVVLPTDQAAIPVTISGTQNENLTQVNSLPVNTGIGAAGAGTQRVAVASDSKIGNTAFDEANGVIAVQPKPLAVATYSPTKFTDLGVNFSGTIKASAGNVFSFACYNDNIAVRYLQIHNTIIAPILAGVPTFTFMIPAKSQIIIGTDFFTEAGLNLSVGISYGFSITINTFTAGVGTDKTLMINYK